MSLMHDPTGAEANLIILIPVYNDWKALSLLLPDLDQQLYANGFVADVLIVDDGSTTSTPLALDQISFISIRMIDVLPLHRNLGHQRAIAVGLAYIEANRHGCSVIVMDCDGEDDPRDVPRLIRECTAKKNRELVFAERTRRSENLGFRCFYQVYRLLHYLLTGVPVRVGNFSVIPASTLRRLVAVSELWNHYAAAVHKARFPMTLVPTQRSRRLEGPSRMNLVALVVHGLSAIAVFGDRIGVRLLIVVCSAMGLVFGALLLVTGIRAFTTLAIPGWATYATASLLIILIQMLLVVFVFAFVILASRDTASIIPSRDYVYFTGGIQRVYGASHESSLRRYRA
jgi:glycosyltransferase involved in cell wall biosynthesis